MEDIKQKYLKKFPIIKGSKKKPYVILFDAYIGYGKSTISKIISNLDGSVILNNDEVKYHLDIHNNSNLIYELQLYRLNKLLKNNNSCIFDCNLGKNRIERVKLISSFGYDYYIIRLECNEKLVKERISKRTLDGINYSPANFEGYLEMKNNVKNIPDELIDYTINTEGNIEEQVKDFLNKYNLI